MQLPDVIRTHITLTAVSVPHQATPRLYVTELEGVEMGSYIQLLFYKERKFVAVADKWHHAFKSETIVTCVFVYDVFGHVFF